MTSPVNVHGAYQGYPYTNPIVIDAPSIDAQTAARWSNLPRRQLIPDRKASIPDHVVYIDIPESGTSGINNDAASSRTAATNLATTINNNNKNEPNDNPIVYIELPENRRIPRDEDRRREDSAESPRRDFVEETIFYDPFEDRRIDVGRNDPPTPGTSNVQPDAPSIPQPHFSSKETNLYGSDRPQTYRPPTVERLPPLIPVTEFPIPPPAYSEVDTLRIPPPPRTEVIVTNPQHPIGIASSDRKLVSCPHCSLRVHTLVVRENACITHLIAILFLLVFLPIGILIYCTDFLKYRNHYCPNCNQLIGYEVPIFCQGMTYTKPV